jgi:hypothetical protein
MPDKMPELARNHFVPAGLLRFFQFDTSPRRRICVYDVAQRCWRHDQRPTNVAFERGLYDHEQDGLDPKLLEKMFQKAEDQALPVIRQLVESTRSPTEAELATLLEFDALQLARVPGFRESLDYSFREEQAAKGSPPAFEAIHRLPALRLLSEAHILPEIEGPTREEVNRRMMRYAADALARMRHCRWILYEAPFVGRIVPHARTVNS